MLKIVKIHFILVNFRPQDIIKPSQWQTANDNDCHCDGLIMSCGRKFTTIKCIFTIFSILRGIGHINYAHTYTNMFLTRALNNIYVFILQYVRQCPAMFCTKKYAFFLGALNWIQGEFNQNNFRYFETCFIGSKGHQNHTRSWSICLVIRKNP